MRHFINKAKSWLFTRSFLIHKILNRFPSTATQEEELEQLLAEMDKPLRLLLPFGTRSPDSTHISSRHNKEIASISFPSESDMNLDSGTSDDRGLTGSPPEHRATQSQRCASFSNSAAYDFSSDPGLFTMPYDDTKEMTDMLASSHWLLADMDIDLTSSTIFPISGNNVPSSRRISAFAAVSDFDYSQLSQKVLAGLPNVENALRRVQQADASTVKPSTPRLITQSLLRPRKM